MFTSENEYLGRSQNVQIGWRGSITLDSKTVGFSLKIGFV